MPIKNRRGALAVERYIDEQLARLHAPLPDRIWNVDPAAGFRPGFEIVYTCKEGRTVRVSFNGEELRRFRQRPLTESLQKCLEAVLQIHQIWVDGRP